MPLKGPAVAMLIPTFVGGPPCAICVGLNTHDRPTGRPEHVYVTAPLNAFPPTGSRFIEVVAVCPGWTDASARVMGTATSVFTVRLTVWLWVIVPSVPWMLKLKVPADVLPTVKAKVPVGFSEAGLGAHVAGGAVPAAVQDKVTVWL